MFGKRLRLFWLSMVLPIIALSLVGCSLGGTPADEVKSAFESHEVKTLIANYRKADENKQIEYRNAYRKYYGEALEKAVLADRKGLFFEEAGLKNWENLQVMGQLTKEGAQGDFTWEKTTAVKVEEFLIKRRVYETNICAPIRKKGIKVNEVLCVTKYLVNKLGSSGMSFYGCDYNRDSFFSAPYPTDRDGCVLDFGDSGYTTITEGIDTFWVVPDGTEKLESARGFVSEVPRYKVLPAQFAQSLSAVNPGGEELDKLCGKLLWRSQKLKDMRPEEVKKPANEEKKNPEKTETVKNQGINGTAQADLQSRGVAADVLVTTYGKSSDGYLAVDKTSQGLRILAVDLKNNRVAEAIPYESLSVYEKDIKSSGKNGSRMIVEFLIKNDSHGADDDFGDWDGNTHRLPIYGLYKMNKRVVEPGMLTSGKGRRPSHFQAALQEKKNVDIMNMFLEQIYPLLNEARSNNINLDGIHK